MKSFEDFGESTGKIKIPHKSFCPQSIIMLWLALLQAKFLNLL